MNIYIAARYDRADEVRALAGTLTVLGHQCVSRWAFGGPEVSPILTGLDDQSRAWAERDLEDIGDCDVFVLLDEPEAVQYRAGRYVELGYAIAMQAMVGIRIILVARRDNVFCHLPSIEFVETADALPALLQADGPAYLLPSGRSSKGIGWVDDPNVIEVGSYEGFKVFQPKPQHPDN